MSQETRSSSQFDCHSLLPSLCYFRANVFFSGAMCGKSEYGANHNHGYLHLVRKGPVKVHTDHAKPVSVDRPSLILLAKPIGHMLEADEQTGADLVCARLSFDGASPSLQLLGFPKRLILALDELDGLEPIIQRLFEEAFAEQYGHQLAVNLLVELLLVMLLRHCITMDEFDTGVLAGLSDPRLARVLMAINEDPAAQWSVESLASKGGMSRASFSSTFKNRIGISPGDYLTIVRLTMTKKALQEGRALKSVASDVGYASTTALSRAFHRRFGCSPREWLKNNET